MCNLRTAKLLYPLRQAQRNGHLGRRPSFKLWRTCIACKVSVSSVLPRQTHIDLRDAVGVDILIWVLKCGRTTLPQRNFVSTGGTKLEFGYQYLDLVLAFILERACGVRLKA